MSSDDPHHEGLRPAGVETTQAYVSVAWGWQVAISCLLKRSKKSLVFWFG